MNASQLLYESIKPIVQNLFPDEKILEIGLWKESYYRVMIKVGDGVDFFIVDVSKNDIIYKEGDWIQVAGQYIKVRRGGKEGLIDVEECLNPRKYIWHQVIPCSYSRIIDFLDVNGLIRVIIDDRWGIIDRFNQIVVSIEYNHLSPIYPLVDGRYRVIARKDIDEPEFNLYISKNYFVEVGNYDVARLTGDVIQTIQVNKD